MKISDNVVGEMQNITTRLLLYFLTYKIGLHL